MDILRKIESDLKVTDIAIKFTFNPLSTCRNISIYFFSVTVSCLHFTDIMMTKGQSLPNYVNKQDEKPTHYKTWN